MNFLKELGLKISVHIPKERKLKVDPKNYFGIGLGLNENTKC